MEDSIYDSQSPEIGKIQEQYETISNYVEHVIKDDSKVELYLQAKKNANVFRVHDFENLPDSLYASYCTIRNKENSIIYIAQTLYSFSGDWLILYENYLDDHGNLICFKRSYSDFSFIRGSESAKSEESIYFFDKNHKLLKKTYKLMDAQKNPVKCETCEKNILLDYVIYKSLDDILGNNKAEFAYNPAFNEVIKSSKKQNYQNQNTDGEEASEVGNTNYNDFPASKYFKVDNIVNAQYLEKEKFETEFEVLNNSNYKFTKFVLSARIYYKFKNSEEVCPTYVQFDGIEPKLIENWEPHTKRKFHIASPGSGYAGSCNIASYERTPDEIRFVLEARLAISVDAETKGAFAGYDLLPQWKERQIKEGLR